MRRLAALAAPLLALSAAGALGLGALLLMWPDIALALLAVLGGGALLAAGVLGIAGLAAAFYSWDK